MKSLYESLLDDFDTLNKNSTLALIQDFISRNYLFNSKSVQNVDSMVQISKKPNKKTGLYEVKCTKKTITIKLSPDAPSLTNDIFTWTTVAGDFIVQNNQNIITLNGCPESVGGVFKCEALPNVLSLENSPKTVGGFMCWGMNSVKTLQFCPIIQNNVSIGYNENLETLKGLEYGSDKINSFTCKNNPKLKEIVSSLPKYVTKSFETGCNGDWRKDDDANLSTLEVINLMNKRIIDFDRNCKITYVSPTGSSGSNAYQNISYYVFN